MARSHSLVPCVENRSGSAVTFRVTKKSLVCEAVMCRMWEVVKRDRQFMCLWRLLLLRNAIKNVAMFLKVGTYS